VVIVVSDTVRRSKRLAAGVFVAVLDTVGVGLDAMGEQAIAIATMSASDD
jgi:hypothetical protein